MHYIFAIHGSLQLLALSIILLLIVYYVVCRHLDSEHPWAGFPIASLPGGFGPRESFFTNAQQTIQSGLQSYSGPFQIITGTGPKIVLPNEFADELRDRPELDFNEAFRKDFFAHYPGFDGFRASLDHPDLIPSTLRVKLTQSLGLVTNHLVEETTSSLQTIYGESRSWHSIYIKQNNLDLIARLSSRVFLGKPACRNVEWLNIAKDHTVDSFMAACALRKQPPLLRRIAHCFMTHNVAIQRHYRDATRIILPEVQRRQERAQQALAAGNKPPRVSDTIGWMVEMSRGKPVDYVAAQLSLTVAAIHATTEALTTALVDLITYPDTIHSLREEIVRVIGTEGWSKRSLSKMKLMDSFLKESQRLHPPSNVSMNRKVMKTLTLSDGTVLPKGSRIMIAGSFRDPGTYPNPDRFEPTRFLELREAGGHRHGAYQYVSTSGNMFAFGHGKHACPGRFLAGNEIKIALAHLLLKYDWKFDGSDTAPKFLLQELAHTTNPMARLMLKRRKEEICLDLGFDPDLVQVEESVVGK